MNQIIDAAVPQTSIYGEANSVIVQTQRPLHSDRVGTTVIECSFPQQQLSRNPKQRKDRK
ncbi:hypothetical protein J6590_038295 [Homalodisca vitripennis]|nr:hypothetical protein J6590_038295 [Homalodisca vitripennis]